MFEKIYRDIEMPLSEVLFKMEQNGVLIDTKLLDQQTVQLNAQAQKLEEQAFEAAGEKFKLSSPKQLGEILFDKMGVVLDGAKPKKTAKRFFPNSHRIILWPRSL